MLLADCCSSLLLAADLVGSSGRLDVLTAATHPLYWVQPGLVNVSLTVFVLIFFAVLWSVYRNGLTVQARERKMVAMGCHSSCIFSLQLLLETWLFCDASM